MTLVRTNSPTRSFRSCSRAVKAKSATVSVPSEVSVVHHVPGELEQARGERAEPGEARIVGVSGQVPVMQLPEHGRQLELCQQQVDIEQRDIERSAERRVGKAGVSTCRSRWLG